MEYICIRACYHKGRRYNTNETVEFSKGEKVPRHFIKKKEYEKEEKTNGQEHADIQIPPIPNSELYYNREDGKWSHEKIIEREIREAGDPPEEKKTTIEHEDDGN